MAFFIKHSSSGDSPYLQSMRLGLLLNGLLSVLFGIVIFANPALLAYLVAAFFVFLGVSLLLTWWRLRRL